MLYIVLVRIDKEVEQEWLAWMTLAHVPDVLATGHFESGRVFRVEDPKEEDGRGGYAIHYACRTRADYDAYKATEAPRLQKEHGDKFEGRFSAKRMLLEPITPEPR
jgi:hypothetical protein